MAQHSPLDLLPTLLSPSAAYVGPLANLYAAQSQLDRFERLHTLHRLEATDHALSRMRSYLESALSAADCLLDREELTDTPPSSPTFRSLLDRFGVQCRSPGKSQFWEAVEAGARAGAYRRWDCRLQIESWEATRKGWFLVFDTITYDPSVHSDEVMFGKYWRQYQRSVQHAVVRSAHGSLRRFRRSGASFSDHVRYFLVPEAHRDGRTHCHILWFVSHLPDTCRLADPNAHSPRVPQRQVPGWPPYPFGMITMRLPVRYRGDNFSRRLGWRLPLDKDGQRPVLKDVNAVARYMAKYLFKPKPETLKCRRIRTSPRLGLETIQAKLSTLTTPQLCLLYRDPRQSLIDRTLYGIRIPTSLLRNQTLREMLLRFKLSLRNLPPGLMRTMWNTLAPVMAINSRPQLQEHLQPTILKAVTSRLPSFIDSVMHSLTCSDISEVSEFFTDHDVSQPFHGHAPTYRPSLGGINY